jgi:hypothetical protein
MPTSFAISAKPRLTLQQSIRFGWPMLRERHLSQRMHRAMLRQGRIGVSAGGGRLLRFTRRWLAYHAEIAVLLGEPERGDVAEARAILASRSPGGPIVEAHPACNPTAAQLVKRM